MYLPLQLGFHQSGCEMVPVTVQLHHCIHFKLDKENHFSKEARHA